MSNTSLTPDPIIWAEFVLMTGDQASPTIHARFSTDRGIDLIAGLVEEGMDIEAAKESFKREMERWVRRG